MKGPAITHIAQVPAPFWAVLVLGTIAKIELDRSQYGLLSPRDVPVDQPGLLRTDYSPDDIGFEPLGPGRIEDSSDHQGIPERTSCHARRRWFLASKSWLLARAS